MDGREIKFKFTWDFIASDGIFGHITVFYDPCIACIIQRNRIILVCLVLWAVYRQGRLPIQYQFELN